MRSHGRIAFVTDSTLVDANHGAEWIKQFAGNLALFHSAIQATHGDATAANGCRFTRTAYKPSRLRREWLESRHFLAAAPVTVDDLFEVHEDLANEILEPSGVLFNDTDADNDPLTAVLAQGPRHGALKLRVDAASHIRQRLFSEAPIRLPIEHRMALSRATSPS